MWSVRLSEQLKLNQIQQLREDALTMYNSAASSYDNHDNLWSLALSRVEPFFLTTIMDFLLSALIIWSSDNQLIGLYPVSNCDKLQTCKLYSPWTHKLWHFGSVAVFLPCSLTNCTEVLVMEWDIFRQLMDINWGILTVFGKPNKMGSRTAFFKLVYNPV